jgi:hypothetical protein
MCSAAPTSVGVAADVGLALGIERPEAVYTRQLTGYNLDSTCCAQDRRDEPLLHVAASALFGSTTSRTGGPANGAVELADERDTAQVELIAVSAVPSHGAR